VRVQGYDFDERLVGKGFENKTPPAVKTSIVSIECDPIDQLDTEHPKLPSIELREMETLAARNERYCADTRIGGG
jgi:hypothetical protein